MDNLKNLDLYGLLDILQDATVKEVKTAYRRKALSCHPDKNPDNPKAAELFHQLTGALEILLDESARAAYDKVINAKKAAALRNQALDSRRKKLKEDLEARERQAQEEASGFKKNTKIAEEKLQAEIERLRKEGSKELEEEVEYVRQKILKKRTQTSVPSSPLYTLQVKWESTKTDETNGGYNDENLNKIFSKYGDILALVVSSKKKGSAMLEFKMTSSAVKAYQLEKGFPSNPLRLYWLSGEPISKMKQNGDRINVDHRGLRSTVAGATTLFPSMKQEPSDTRSQLFPSFPSTKPLETQSDQDYENQVLKNLKQAEERKRGIEEDT
uniref:DnaJ homolog subfamily C member 17 n=1 Tax=Clastoptera arizonana TaxID=38151 RepID=A0A1B6DJR7_9HEMI